MPEQLSSLSIYAYRNSSAFPVENVQITLSDPNTDQEVFAAETNAEGKVPPVLLSTPPIELSLNPNMGQPFSTWNVEAQFPDGSIIQVFGVQTYPETNALLEIINRD